MALKMTAPDFIEETVERFGQGLTSTFSRHGLIAALVKSYTPAETIRLMSIENRRRSLSDPLQPLTSFVNGKRFYSSEIPSERLSIREAEVTANAASRVFGVAFLDARDVKFSLQQVMREAVAAVVGRDRKATRFLPEFKKACRAEKATTLHRLLNLAIADLKLEK
ncbi:MAG TPA: hypothetical protein DEA55_02275 [Rhodospirillaceae bacterium]|nr:hypothetical protein [Rhodospirillaceae bacterium]